MSESSATKIDAGSVTSWDHDVDVIVVGLGCAGVCAGIEAMEAGARVLVLERASAGGGTTALAGGHLYLGGGTRVQKACGVEDDAESMFDYLMAVSPAPDAAKIRRYCEESAAHFDWLVEHGVPFEDSIHAQKTVLQASSECLIWSGNEKVWPYLEKAKPAPRGHKVAKEGDAGPLLMEVLTRHLEEGSAELGYDAKVDGIVTESGRVVGVRYRRFDDVFFARASRGVLLAAGGFGMNKAMLKEHAPRLADRRVMKQGNPNDDGLGIQLGLLAGAAADHMEGCLITSPFYPPSKLLNAILVNGEGRRFINEDSYHARTSASILEQPKGVAYLITDDECFGYPELMGQKLKATGESIAELEQELGLPEGSLVETVAEHNEHAAKGDDPVQHKYKDWLKPLDKPPYGAIDCSFGKAYFIGFTLGGLRTDVDGRVLSESNAAIDGLYAAGACASNIAQDGTGYSSGTCIGEGTFFGRRAGRHLASR